MNILGIETSCDDTSASIVKDGKYIVPDKTLFYPKSGGQPNDTGVFIRKFDNKQFTSNILCVLFI